MDDCFKLTCTILRCLGGCYCYDLICRGTCTNGNCKCCNYKGCAEDEFCGLFAPLTICV